MCTLTSNEYIYADITLILFNLKEYIGKMFYSEAMIDFLQNSWFSLKFMSN